MNAPDPLDGDALLARLDALGTISERPDMLVRRFVTPELRRAGELIAAWMREAGMAVRTDAIGNIVGRYEGDAPGLPALFLGSHLDTVIDAGKYDGPLGIVTAIACVDRLRRFGVRRPFAIEVIGFADEEGARFGTTLLGSRAVAGNLDPAVLAAVDDLGTTMEEAMRGYGLDPAELGRAARRREEALAYVELHIEQGPVLESRNLPVGCVTAINGATRLRVSLAGMAGHAGTVPMASRRDALAGAAECVLAVERRCAAVPELVGTVGRLAARPGAVNVIPGEASFTIDIRAPRDEIRRHALQDLRAEFAALATRRRLGLTIEVTHDAPSSPCAPWLMDRIDAAIAAEGIAPLRLASGAGHDGMAMRALAPIGMIFVRCEGGISHNPREAISAVDAATGGRVLQRFIKDFAAPPPPASKD